MTSGYVSASFDLLNIRDLDVINQALSQCDYLVVGVLSDECVEASRGLPPVVPLDERVELCGHLRGVNEVIVVHDTAATPLLPADCVIFVVDGEVPGFTTAAPPLVLHPTRETKSQILRQALRRTTEAAVVA
jgi:cytidyltransferase-like protein